MGVRMLAAGRTKVTLLTAKPADPESPTATELNAGIQICQNIPAGEFTFGATDSETIDTTSLCSENKSEVFGQGNFQLSFGLWRRFLDAGGFDTTDDAAFAAVMEKGTTVWVYARLTDKKATENWAADDEIFLGAEAVTDTPTPMSATEGFIGYRVPTRIQLAWPFIKVATA